MNPLAVDLAEQLHRIGAIQFGHFTLKDGRESPFYVDLRLLISDPGVLRQAGHAMAERARDLSSTASPACPTPACRSPSRCRSTAGCP
jgi:orotate phosphoribosyltransferase